MPEKTTPDAGKIIRSEARPRKQRTRLRFLTEPVPELMDDPALAKASIALQNIENNLGLSLQQRVTLRQSLLNEALEAARTAAEPNEQLPTTAPELWSDREGRKENPVAFIRRVYARWLSRGLTRNDLRTLDRPLYQALAVWMHRHPSDNFPELPSETERAAEKLKRVPSTRDWRARLRATRRKPHKYESDM